MNKYHEIVNSISRYIFAQNKKVRFNEDRIGELYELIVQLREKSSREKTTRAEPF